MNKSFFNNILIPGHVPSSSQSFDFSSALCGPCVQYNTDKLYPQIPLKCLLLLLLLLVLLFFFLGGGVGVGRGEGALYFSPRCELKTNPSVQFPVSQDENR